FSVIEQHFGVADYEKDVWFKKDALSRCPKYLATSGGWRLMASSLPARAWAAIQRANGASGWNRNGV
ncbi:MAG: hypothetical protein K8F34_01720, partial [Candidatus Kuenenia stuttgartiensis]|nr:hypothetical protein [Candidatus Kuenenia stuttgartiensis]